MRNSRPIEVLIHKLLRVVLNPTQDTTKLPSMLDLGASNMPLQRSNEHENVHSSVFEVGNRPKK